MRKIFTSVIAILFAFNSIHAQSCWSALSSVYGTGGGGGIFAMTEYNSNLIAGGYFYQAGSQTTSNIASWNGSSWSALGSGINNIPYNSGYSVLALTTFHGDLIAGGSFDSAGGAPANGIAKWNGSSWSPLGAGITGNTHNYADGGAYSTPYVTSLAVYNNDLYAGGVFTHAGSTRAGDVARWDGSSWTALATGIDTDGIVACMTVYNGKLIVGGDFNNAGGVQVANIAAWDGTAWTPLGVGLGSTTVGYQYEAVEAMAVYNGELYASLSGTDGLGNDYFFVAKWDGTNWTGVAGGPGTGTTYRGEVLSMMPLGGDLIVCGKYSVMGNDSSTRCITKWNGSTWSGLDSFHNVSNYDICLASYNGHLIVGGNFSDQGGTYAINIAENTCLTTGIHELAPAHVTVSPNPSNGLFTIGLEDMQGEAEVEVYDLMGRKISQSALRNTKTVLDLSDKAQGTYLYRIRAASGEQISSGSLVIQ